MRDCCKANPQKNKKCKRKSDGKIFKLPRKFSKTRCTRGPVKGFTMRSSCAPYLDCWVNLIKSVVGKQFKEIKFRNT